MKHFLIVVAALILIGYMFSSPSKTPSEYNWAARHYEDMAAESLRLQQKRDESFDRYLRSH